MKLIAYDLSRLTALFTFEPQSYYFPAVIPGFIGRYKFVGYPALDQVLMAGNSNAAVEFKHGVFEGTAIDSLQIYRDGIVVSARANTDVHDSFVKDLMEWIIQDLKGSIIQNHIQNRMYESCFVFEPEKDLLNNFIVLHKIQSRLSDMLKKNSAIKAEFHPFGISIATDPNTIPGIKPATFQVERWAQADFSLNKFFTRAPLNTSQHIELIKMMEELL